MDTEDPDLLSDRSIETFELQEPQRHQISNTPTNTQANNRTNSQPNQRSRSQFRETLSRNQSKILLTFSMVLFLTNIGVALFALYVKCQPDSVPDSDGPLHKQQGSFFTSVAPYLAAHLSNKIKIIIPEWYNYKYDAYFPFDHIENGGRNMYDGGNKVCVSGKEKDIQVIYGRHYRIGKYHEDEFITFANYPFLALMWIENFEQNPVAYTIRVKSRIRTSGKGNTSSLSGEIRHTFHLIRYYAVQVHSAQDVPSICEVYFLVSSEKRWSSSGQYAFNSSFSEVDDIRDNFVRIIGNPNRLLMGYTLLSKVNGSMVLRSEIEHLLLELALVLDTVSPDPGWITPWNGYQYRLTDVTQSWNNSRRNCQDYGGDLIAFGMRDFDTLQIITRRLGRSPNNSRSLWIGLTRLSNKKSWKWIDGEKAIPSNMKWYKRRPIDDVEQDCPCIHQEDGRKIHACLCLNNNFAICEKEMNTTSI